MLRHRLLDAILRRLARHPDADGFVLRGGVRVRQLVPGTRRAARDLDLVCLLPYDRAAVCRTVTELLAAELPGEPWFDVGAIRLDDDWRPVAPGLRLVVDGTVGGVTAPVAVDLRVHLPLGPPTDRVDGVRALRPESIAARQLRVLTDLGRGGWRPKDLADLAALAPILEPTSLGAAIDAVFADGRADPREVFGRPAWWSGRAAAARWADAGGDTLDAVVGRVRAAFAPVLG
ncbi:MAG: nucleotidyl transferase AbiEii/AbiGii toxin family protein [Myxococcota bacterium]